jgi:hypothetical protein
VATYLNPHHLCKSIRTDCLPRQAYPLSGQFYAFIRMVRCRSFLWPTILSAWRINSLSLDPSIGSLGWCWPHVGCRTKTMSIGMARPAVAVICLVKWVGIAGV